MSVDIANRFSRLMYMLVRIRFSQWIPWLALIISIAVTYGLWRSAQQEAEQKLQNAFNFRVHEIERRIEQRMLAYEQVLRGEQGLFASSISVERGEFRAYNKKLSLEEYLPGIQGIGYAEIVHPAEKNKIISAIRKEGFPNFTLWPEGKRDIYTSLIYIEPFSVINQRPIGYDMYTEPMRRAAMEQARDIDDAVLSGRITLVADAGKQQYGFKMFLPIFKNGVPHDTLAERRANIQGWVYGLFRMNDLMWGILGDTTADLDVEIYDGEELTSDTNLFDQDHIPRISVNEGSRFLSIQKVMISHRVWTVVVNALPDFEAKLDNRNPAFVATVGLGMSMLLVFLIVLEKGRIRALETAAKMNTELVESEERWRFALEGSGEGVWDWNIKSGDINYSTRWKRILGYEKTDSVSNWLDHIHPEDQSMVKNTMQEYLGGVIPEYAVEYRLQRKDGSYAWMHDRGMIVSRDSAEKPLRMIGTLTDITQRKKTEDLVWQQANYDPLTLLPNRRMFHDRLELEIKKSHRTGLPFAVVFLDLDGFKEVNDSLGHAAGDLLLSELAQRLRVCVRQSDTVARLGGDEFTFILSEMDDLDSISRIAQVLLEKVNEPFDLNHEMVYISPSIGITLFPADATNVEDLLKNADQAMYAAKQQGRNRINYFTPSMQKAAQFRMQMIKELRGALANHQFIIHYQPIVNLSTNKTYKAEALIRWQHPKRGLIYPDSFIQIAEETGLINDIGSWVFHEVALHAKRLRALHDAKFQISLNKSPVQFHKEDASHATWFDYLLSIDLPGQGIVVEITEGMLLDASNLTKNKLQNFHNFGIQVSLDDFGIGYSSLSYLQKFDIDYLKIDKSFVQNITTSSDNMVLCETIIVMAHKLGMEVIAEGVETIAQRDLLIAAGCDYAQGYLFSKPIPAPELEEWLADNR